MKTYGFNLLPQKSRALVHKEDKRDNYSVAIAILPLTAVVIWLALILFNVYVVDAKKLGLEALAAKRQQFINNDLAPILIANGEMVTKTNALAEVIDQDVQPEQLFQLIDKIYSNQDDSFRITGYSRNRDGSFSVTMLADSFLRLTEITRRFENDDGITGVKLDNATVEDKSELISGSISFFFTYKAPENDSE